MVANRAPVTYARDGGGERVARRGGGGLVTALGGLLGHHDVTWIASAMSEEDRAVAREQGDEAAGETARDGSPYRLRLLAHEPDGAVRGAGEELTEGGLGIAIIRSIADEIEIGGGPGGRGSRLRFVKRL